MPITPLDRLYLQRCYELAVRAQGNTAPNPLVGSVIVRDGRIVGEGYHHRAGDAHAEVNALAAAGGAARGATAYVSLEPCNHTGKTPPCTHALVNAAVARVVIGTRDPNPTTDGRGVAYLQERGILVDEAHDARARAIIEPFAYAVVRERPFLAVKMAMSLDGFITSKPGVQEWITGEPERLYVRDLRIAHDAVMVGAGTVRVDDPQLTVRPPHHRVRPYVRVIACETDTIPESSRVLNELEDYRRTVILAPAGARARFDNVRDRAEVLFVGDDASQQLDLDLAMRALRDAGVTSVLCEGGPTLAGRLIAQGLADRIYWAIAPMFLRTDTAVPALAGVDLASLRKRVAVDGVVQLGDDVVITGLLHDTHEDACLAD